MSCCSISLGLYSHCTTIESVLYLELGSSELDLSELESSESELDESDTAFDFPFDGCTWGIVFEGSWGFWNSSTIAAGVVTGVPNYT